MDGSVMNSKIGFGIYSKFFKQYSLSRTNSLSAINSIKELFPKNPYIIKIRDTLENIINIKYA